MLKGLSFLALRALPLLLLSAPAWATNDTLYINSQGGDSVGNGLQATYTDSDGNFVAAEDLSSGNINGVTIKFNASVPNASWTLAFNAPEGAALATGNYDGTVYSAGLAPLQPSMTVNYCEFGAYGHFIVRQFTTDGLGDVTSFAADFQQVCGGKGSLTGAIRFNSTIPVSVDQPTSDAGTHQLVQPGATVQLDGSLSLPGNGSITTYTWTQLSGPAISFSNPSIVNPTFVAPSVSLGGADVVLQLEVDNSLALSDFSSVTIHVANPADPLTLFTVTTDAGAFLPINGTITLNPFQAMFTTATLNTTQGVGVGVSGIYPNWAGMDFAAPTGTTLQIGTYDGAQRYPFQSSSLPGIDFTYGSSGCNTETGRFAILDLQKDGSGAVTSFAADFEQHCEGQAAASRGKIRINSTVPLDAPVADSVPIQTILQGETVTLQGGSWPTGTDGDDITSYQWTQLSGTTVTLSDPTAADPTFSAPSEPAGGENLVFQLTVTNSLGISSTTLVTVHIANPADVTTMLRIETTGGSGLPSWYTLTPAESAFSVNFSGLLIYAPAGVHIFSTNPAIQWNIVLAGPAATPAAPPGPGTYDVPTTLPIFGAVYLTGPIGFSCSGTVTARFAILDIQQAAGNAINSVAADYDQFCSNSNAVQHGVLRYNSSVPLDTPVSDPGTKQIAVPGSTVTLSGATSYAGGDADTLVSYQWSQLSGAPATLSDASAVSPTFTAPTVTVGGSDLVFQLTVTNSNGLSNSSDVTVHVAAPGDPLTLMVLKSDAGDPVGQGQTVTLSTLNAVFSAGNAPVFTGVTNQPVQVIATTSVGPISAENTAWNLQITAPLGQALQVGSYDSIVAYSNTQSLGQPGLSAFYTGPFSESGGCDFASPVSGFFDVLDIQRDQNNSITSLAVDFVQQCTGASGALHGKIRYNSAVPLDQPFADAGHAQTVQVGQTVSLGGTGSVAGADGSTITSVQWTQTGGPTVSLSDPTSADPNFIAPTVTTGTDLTFTVTITNSDGVSSTSTVTIHVDGPNDPKTVMYLQGSPGDIATQGETVTLVPTNAIFTATASAGNSFISTPGNTITIAANQVPPVWNVILQAPNGGALQNGQDFPLAQELDFEKSPDAGILVDGIGNCAISSGQFRIRDLQHAQDGSISSFAADLIQYCVEGPTTTRVNGWVRFNSTVPLGTPIAVAGSGQTTYTGFSVALDGSQSVGGPGNPIASYQWTQLQASGDPAVTLTGAATTTPSFTAPSVPLGGKDLRFQLTVTSASGLTDTQIVTVHVGSQNDPKSLLLYASQPGDPVGGGAQGLVLSPENGSVGAGFSLESVDAEVLVNTPGIFFNWDLSFDVGFPGLVPGVYAFDSVDFFPVMLVSSGATCNSPTGLFIVRDVQKGSNGSVDGAGIDFVQHCAGATGVLQGALRVNSKSPTQVNQPTAYAGPDLLASSPGLVPLDGSSSFIGWSGPVRYQWVQLSGPTVQLVDRAKAVAGFVLPASLMSTKGTSFGFQLTVSNSQGQSSSSHVTVIGQQQFTGLLSFQSDAGDPIGQGQTASFSLQDGALSVQKGTDNSLRATMASNGYWVLDFAAKNRQLLKPGTYSDATLFRLVGTPVPGLSVTAGGRRCNTVSGDFTVRDVQYVGGAVSSLAIDFDQFCNGSSAGLHGKLRYHSAVP